MTELNLLENQVIVELCEGVIDADQELSALVEGFFGGKRERSLEGYRFAVGLSQSNLYIFSFIEENRRFRKPTFDFAGQEVIPLTDIEKWKMTGEKGYGTVVLQYVLELEYKLNRMGEFWFCMNVEDGAEVFRDAWNATMISVDAKSKSTSVTKELKELNLLRKEGVLSEDEFTRAKEIFIGRKPDAQVKMASSLRSLKQLRDSGVLSEAEYATKKWEVISA